MARVKKESATLVSSGGTNYVYVNRKNSKKFKGEKKQALKKYDPKLRKHVIFNEKKLSRLKAKAPQAQEATPAPTKA